MSIVVQRVSDRLECIENGIKALSKTIHGEQF